MSLTITNPEDHVILDQQPTIWPECPTCHAAWAWRLCITFTGAKWLYTRDCKHKAQPVLVTKDGPYEPAEDSDA